MVGWIFGIACVGVSEPVNVTHGGGITREQFTDTALADIAKRAGREGHVVPLTWGHRGEVLTDTSGLNMLFQAHELYGLTFTARIVKDTPLTRRVLEDLERGVMGVSVGFLDAEGWSVERKGFGPVRIISRARLHHVALLPRESKRNPAYPACWASGCRGRSWGCPKAVRETAEGYSWKELVRQAKVMS